MCLSGISIFHPRAAFQNNKPELINSVMKQPFMIKISGTDHLLHYVSL